MERKFILTNNVVYAETAEQSFDNGYKTGKSWSCKYRPGGPWIPREVGSTDPNWIGYCVAKRENNSEWLRGFDKAIDERSPA